jgi:hypothetical protein
MFRFISLTPFGVIVPLSDFSPALTLSDLQLPLSLADDDGVVRVAVVSRNLEGCEATLTASEPIQLSAPTLTYLVERFGGDVIGGTLSETRERLFNGSRGNASALLDSLALAAMALQVKRHVACQPTNCAPCRITRLAACLPIPR